MASSEYDPLFGEPAPEAVDDLGPVRERFGAASRPFLRSPWPWLAWALLLSAAALATPAIARAAGPAGVLFAWSAAILLGGAGELVGILRAGRSIAGSAGTTRTPLSRWVLSVQGNLSLAALGLSVYLLWADRADALPGLWLLLLGHSFYLLGGLAFPPMRTCGLLYQLGGLAALWPAFDPLVAFAAATAAGNAWLALGIFRARR